MITRRGFFGVIAALVVARKVVQVLEPSFVTIAELSPRNDFDVTTVNDDDDHYVMGVLRRQPMPPMNIKLHWDPEKQHPFVAINDRIIRLGR